jgi:hypothetical protein
MAARGVLMKILSWSLFCLFAISLGAQEPAPVPLSNEPHHQLILENSYVRVFRVSVPAHGATILHEHKVPYLYVALGSADFVNAVPGKPEEQVKMEDGQVGYSSGGFAHIVRNNSGLAFNNITVELLKPQGNPHNWCQLVVADQPAECVGFAPPGQTQTSLFRTDEIKVFLDALEPKRSLKWQAFSSALVIPLSNSQLRTSYEKHSQNLDSGGAEWIPSLPSHEGRWLSFKNRGKSACRFVLVLFEENASPTSQ